MKMKENAMTEQTLTWISTPQPLKSFSPKAVLLIHMCFMSLILPMLDCRWLVRNNFYPRL